MKNKPGRPPITRYLSEDRIAKAYQVEGSVRGAARRLGTTHRTVAKYLRKMGFEINEPRHWVYTERKKPTRHSKFAKWLRDNQGTQLPRSVKQLAELSECSYPTVNCYMYRRRRKVRDILDSCPDLIEAGTLIKASNMPEGEPDVINSRRFTKYRYHIDSYTLDVRIEFDTDEYKGLIAEIPDVPAFVAYVVEHYSL